MQNPNQKTSKENKLVWEAWEFKANRKSRGWYIGFGVVAAGLIAWAYFEDSFLTMFTFIVMAAVWLIYTLQKPQMVKHELGSTGVKVGQTFLPYRNIKKFWIIYNNEAKTLNFETTSYLNNQITLQLGKEHPSEIKNFLKKYLQEDLDKDESFTDVLARRVKF